MSIFRRRRAGNAESRLEFDGVGVRKTRGAAITESVAWSDLRGVEIWTTDDGPFAEDMFWVLHGPNDTGIVVPAGQVPEDFVPRLQALPGFDNQALIDASGSTRQATFLCWRAS